MNKRPFNVTVRHKTEGTTTQERADISTYRVDAEDAATAMSEGLTRWAMDEKCINARFVGVEAHPIPIRDYEELAFDKSKTERRELRRDVRRVLGTSSDDPPTAFQAVRAAQYLSEILIAASSGRLCLKVFDWDNKPITFGQARDWVDQQTGRTVGPRSASAWVDRR